MHQGTFIFKQVCDSLPYWKFDELVKKYQGNRYVKDFTCWNYLMVLIFGQLLDRESCRDLICALEVHRSKWHHLGMGKKISRSNLSYASQHRDYRIFKEFAEYVIAQAQKARNGYNSISETFKDKAVYAFDSSTISLCLSIFEWCRYRYERSAVKLHTLFDVQKEIPVFNIVTEALPHDSTAMKEIPYESEAFYIFDRAYMNTTELYSIHLKKAFFVVREKTNMLYDVVEDKLYCNQATGILHDQIIRLTGSKTQEQYPENLRRIVFYDGEHDRVFVFYTNNTDITPEEVALLYKNRWKVELFFKWMKQHLRIKEFYGTSENAVKIQIFSAIITYCLVAIVQQNYHIEVSTYTVLRKISAGWFETCSIPDLFVNVPEETNLEDEGLLYLKF